MGKPSCGGGNGGRSGGGGFSNDLPNEIKPLRILKQQLNRERDELRQKGQALSPQDKQLIEKIGTIEKKLEKLGFKKTGFTPEQKRALAQQTQEWQGPGKYSYP